MRDFYEDFYRLTTASAAHAEFCERVFGRNLCQHGFSDMAQLDALIAALRLQPDMRVLDLGCGSGMIAEYISDCTGAQVTGLDYIPEAIRLAHERTASKADRLAFGVGDINALDLPPQAFDAVISIDSLYFSDDYARTIAEWVRALRPGGQMGIFFAHGREPWVPKEEFPTESVLPDQTPLAQALQANGLSYTTHDFTSEDYRIAQLRRHVLPELRARFEADGILFVYDNRLGDASGISEAIEDGLHRRYLYHVQLDESRHA
jgi:cyclopropane fatty-acyl-phospholipid synthase-like methyltransferase